MTKMIITKSVANYSYVMYDGIAVGLIRKEGTGFFVDVVKSKGFVVYGYYRSFSVAKQVMRSWIDDNLKFSPFFPEKLS